jgi:hypothetical protein
MQRQGDVAADAHFLMLSAGIAKTQNIKEAKPPERKLAVPVFNFQRVIGSWHTLRRRLTSNGDPCRRENPRMNNWVGKISNEQQYSIESRPLASKNPNIHKN